LARDPFFDNLGSSQLVHDSSARGGLQVRKLGAGLLAAAIALGGLVLMVLAGLIALLITDPLYPFAPVFLPLALLVAWLTAWMMGRVPLWVFRDHPDRRRWTRIGWVVTILGLAAWGAGVYHLATMQIHWQ
jgi:hypothetical protein